MVVPTDLVIPALPPVDPASAGAGGADVKRHGESGTLVGPAKGEGPAQSSASLQRRR